MLTAHHIDDDGHEIVIPAERVTFHPPGEDGYGAVRLYRDGGASVIASGLTTIANASGRVVATYDLRLAS